jgi:transposase
LPGTKYGARGTVFRVAPQDRLIKCPDCGSRNVTRKGACVRRLLASQVGSHEKITLEASIPIVHCKDCRARKMIDPAIALPKKSYTKGFARDVLVLLREMSVLSVARFLQVSWGMISSILTDWLEKHFSRRGLRNLRRIAIDETSVGKGHRYVTIVMDLDTGDPVFVGDGKAERALDPFWKELGPRRARKIRCVAMDMGGAYQAAVRKNLPWASIVFDRFHVVKLANERIDRLRRRLFAMKDFEGRELLKGSRFLLLKNPENLDASRGEPGRLRRLLDLNSPLTTMYILKEDLRRFWEMDSREKAEEAAREFIGCARASGVPEIVSLGSVIERHMEGILNHYGDPVSSGPLEGLNNKVKALVRRAYGYRNMHVFKLLVMAARVIDPYRLRPFDTS